jgi:hypothetical protein
VPNMDEHIHASSMCGDIRLRGFRESSHTPRHARQNYDQGISSALPGRRPGSVVSQLAPIGPQVITESSCHIVSRGLWGIDISSMRKIMQKHIQTCMHEGRSEEVHSENRIAR